MLLDRLLDRAGLEVSPFALCDVRSDTRVELPPPSELHLHCVTGGRGTLCTAGGFRAALAPATLALVPIGCAHVLEPLGGGARSLSVDSARQSDHIPKLIVGRGAPGLVVVCARVRAAAEGAPALFDGLTQPLVIDLAATPGAPLFAALSEEIEQRLPANRRIAGLLMQQCLMHALRQLWNDEGSPLRALSSKGASPG